jgi:hypothetical protein
VHLPQSSSSSLLKQAHAKGGGLLVTPRAFVAGGLDYSCADNRMPEKFDPTLIFASLSVLLKRFKSPEKDQN